MKCCDCSVEIVAPARACAECLKKSIIDCMEASKASMELYRKHLDILDKAFVDCSTPEGREAIRKEYKSVSNMYDYSRLNVLYCEYDLGLGGIPRPVEKKSKRKSMSEQWQEAYS